MAEVTGLIGRNLPPGSAGPSGCPTPFPRPRAPMSPTHGHLKALLARAAELRAAGASWAKIAAEVGRAVKTCSQWPSLYPAWWGQLLRAAEDRLSAESGAEARVVLRKLLRSEDEKIVLAAA